jgi:cupin fold WbuC family metalloprotein
MPSDFKRALEPPTDPVALISRQCLEATVAAARQSPRQRMIQPFHRTAGASVHRMFNALQPGSYARPHRHLNPPKDEAFVVLRGALAFFTFEEDGRVRDCLRLQNDGELLGVDITAGVYHSIAALEPDTIVYEVKAGPYNPVDDKDFAPWSPAETDPSASTYLKELLAQYRRQSRDGP